MIVGDVGDFVLMGNTCTKENSDMFLNGLLACRLTCSERELLEHCRSEGVCIPSEQPVGKAERT